MRRSFRTTTGSEAARRGAKLERRFLSGLLEMYGMIGCVD